MDDVKVHYNSDKPAQLQAHAYAQGTEIHLGAGQEKHLPHEAWHVVQQKQGRVKPTFQMKGKVNINDDEGLEKEADIMGAKALQMQSNYGNASETTKKKQRFATPTSFTVQRYTTKSSGLTVAGELHTKKPDHRMVEKNFVHHVKSVDPGTLCYWQEFQMPGSGSLKKKPKSSEHPDHFIAWDIDRMKHHYQLIATVLADLTAPLEETATLDKVEAAQVALSASSMIETLDFIRQDLQGRDKSFDEVKAAYLSMRKEYGMVFQGLLDGAKGGALIGTVRKAFATAKFTTALETINQQITLLLPELSETRKIASYDFTRSNAMNDLANQKKGVKGVWMIGEYHAQEIEEHLSDNIQYDLVSMNDFNADILAFDKSQGGSTINVDYLGELLTLSRKLSGNLEYFVSEKDKTETMKERLAHWGRCMDVLFAFEGLIRKGLAEAKVSKALLPGGVNLKDILELVEIIHVGLDKERESTLAYDLESGGDSLPKDLYSLVRDAEVLKAAKDLNVLTGLAEFGK